MKRPLPSASRRTVGMVLAAVLLTCMAIGTACSNQGEGERCDTDDDCQSGLRCQTNNLPQYNNQVVPRCCPPANPTALDCKAPIGSDDGGDNPQPDSSTTPTPDAETDSGSDAETDSGSDGSIQDASDQ